MAFNKLFIKQIASATFVNLSRAIYITTLSWTAMQVGGKFSSVGQVLLWGNLAGLIISPFSGVLIDKNDRKYIAIAGAALFSTSMIAFAVASYFLSPMPILWVLASTAGIGQAIVIPTQEAIIQGSTTEEHRSSLAPILNMVRQMGLILGALMGGALVWLAPMVGFIFAAAGMIASACLLIGMNDAPGRASKTTVDLFFKGLMEGGRFMAIPTILSCAIVSTSAYAIGQVSNAVLPSYVHDVLSLSAWHFGVIDSMWSLGAFSAALAITRISFLKTNPRFARYGLLIMALSFGTLATSQYFSTTIALFYLLGVGFSIAKVLSDIYLLINVPNQYFGRVRSNISTFTGLIGVLIYLLPTLLPDITTQRLMGYASIYLITAFFTSYSLLNRR